MNIDLAPTFLNIAGVMVPPHMDGKSFLPLVVNRRKNIKDRWPDTFLIESSGRRESYDKILAHRTKLSQFLASTVQSNETVEESDDKDIDLPQDLLAKTGSLFFSSHEEDDDVDDDDEGEGKFKLRTKRLHF